MHYTSVTGSLYQIWLPHGIREQFDPRLTLADPSWPLHELWIHQCITLLSEVFPAKFGAHRVFLNLTSGWPLTGSLQIYALKPHVPVPYYTPMPTFSSIPQTAYIQYFSSVDFKSNLNLQISIEWDWNWNIKRKHCCFFPVFAFHVYIRMSHRDLASDPSARPFERAIVIWAVKKMTILDYFVQFWPI